MVFAAKISLIVISLISGIVLLFEFAAPGVGVGKYRNGEFVFGYRPNEMSSP